VRDPPPAGSSGVRPRCRGPRSSCFSGWVTPGAKSFTIRSLQGARGSIPAGASLWGDANRQRTRLARGSSSRVRGRFGSGSCFDFLQAARMSSSRAVRGPPATRHGWRACSACSKTRIENVYGRTGRDDPWPRSWVCPEALTLGRGHGCAHSTSRLMRAMRLPRGLGRMGLRRGPVFNAPRVLRTRPRTGALANARITGVPPAVSKKVVGTAVVDPQTDRLDSLLANYRAMLHEVGRPNYEGGWGRGARRCRPWWRNTGGGDNSRSPNA